MAAKDLRMKTTSEALRSMRILKLQVEIYTTVVASLNNLIFSILLLSSEQCVCVCVKFPRSVRTACQVITLELKEFDFKWMPVA